MKQARSLLSSFTVRDLMWLMLVIAVVTKYERDFRPLRQQVQTLQTTNMELQSELGAEYWYCGELQVLWKRILQAAADDDDFTVRRLSKSVDEVLERREVSYKKRFPRR